MDEKRSIEKNNDSGSEIKIDHAGRNINAKLANPLYGLSQEQLMKNAARFAQDHNLGHLTDEFQKGALVAQDPAAFESISILSEEDKNVLRRELTHRWSQPWQLYYLVILCSLAAAVQGMDESVINGANLFFAPQFGLQQSGVPDASRNQWLLGLANIRRQFKPLI